MSLRSELARLARKRSGCYLPYLRGGAGALYCIFCIDADRVPDCNGECCSGGVFCQRNCPCNTMTQERLEDFIRVMETRIQESVIDE